jgi:IS30 family transposase
MGRRRLGALPQVEKRKRYARLIGQGFSSLEACRIVGVNPRTGKRWRHGCARAGPDLRDAQVRDNADERW